jgi:hypothetical protein
LISLGFKDKRKKKLKTNSFKKKTFEPTKTNDKKKSSLWARREY